MTATAADSPSQRTEANRKNTQKSCGPRTRPARTAHDSMHSSMACAKLPSCPARTPTPPGSPRLLDGRLPAADDIDRYLVKPAVNVSWQLDRADRTWEARRKRDLLDAGADQAAAIADEVLVLGGRLFHDPRGPACFYPQGEPDFSYPRGSRKQYEKSTK